MSKGVPETLPCCNDSDSKACLSDIGKNALRENLSFFSFIPMIGPLFNQVASYAGSEIYGIWTKSKSKDSPLDQQNKTLSDINAVVNASVDEWRVDVTNQLNRIIQEDFQGMKDLAEKSKVEIAEAVLPIRRTLIELIIASVSLFIIVTFLVLYYR